MSSDEIYCLKEICAEDKEEEAINFLFKSLSEKYKEALRKKAEYGAIIRAVKAINNGKNESIDNLCDIDDECKEDIEDAEQEIKGTCRICLHSTFNSSGMLKCIPLGSIVASDDTCDMWHLGF